MQTIAYLRVSTDSQDLEKNKADILHFANEKRLGNVEWVEEKVSGQVPWGKRKIAQVIDTLQPGGSLVVSELSRLGRSLLEIMEMLSVATRKEIHVYSVKGNWALDGTLQSKIIATVFAIAAEIERELISARTKEALAARKRSGLPLGRPRGPGKSKLDKFKPEIEALLKNGTTQRFIAKRYGSTEANLYNWMKRHGLERNLTGQIS
jgi:DNA invertase Pin-like site-specific DNA recombinase